MIQASQVRIERLNSAHDLSSFKSYERELVDFLVEDALDNQNKKISVTYLWFLKDELIGYLSLLNDRINLEGDLQNYFREKGILYRSLPALKVGRLCVDDRFLKRGIGTLMLQFAVITAERIFDKYAGCRFIVLDAKRNQDKSKDSIHFYKKIGLRVLKERKKGTTPMYWDLSSEHQTSSLERS
ncbi:MAG TPA: GNAT family N-acetyltransferase [Candidatus Nanoarchaeia archaeon]|nr:GNAT family N-acetyltransferase [Candidatus Nanoarchaeia archaeon]